MMGPAAAAAATPDEAFLCCFLGVVSVGLKRASPLHLVCEYCY